MLLFTELLMLAFIESLLLAFIESLILAIIESLILVTFVQNLVRTAFFFIAMGFEMCMQETHYTLVYRLLCCDGAVVYWGVLRALLVHHACSQSFYPNSQSWMQFANSYCSSCARLSASCNLRIRMRSRGDMYFVPFCCCSSLISVWRRSSRWDFSLLKSADRNGVVNKEGSWLVLERRHTSKATKTWVTYGNSHLACK